MNVRLIVGKFSKSGTAVYPLLCMDCENDVFEWLNSQEVIDTTTGKTFTLGTYACAHCGFVTSLDESTFLIEATDDKAGWLSRRHAGIRSDAGKPKPSNKRVKRSPTPRTVRS